MTIIIAIIALIFLIVIHELGHMLTAKALGVHVPEFGVGFGPALFKRKFGKTIYSFRIILLGGFAKMAGMGDDETGPHTYYEKAAWRRALIIFAGPFANLIAAVVILAAVFMFAGQVTGATNEVVRVVPDSMASEVGIQNGDRLVAVDSESVGGWEAFTRAVGEKQPGDNVEITVVRDGSEREFSGQLTANPDDAEAPFVGVGTEPITQTYGFFESIGLSVERIGDIMVLLVQFIGQLITGQESFYDNVTGPVGIATVGGEVASAGLVPFATLVAFISLNLGVMNLLPILPLDGGHLLFIAMEKIKGRRISEATMNRVALIGLMLVLTLFLFATYADLSKILSGQPFIPDQ